MYLKQFSSVQFRRSVVSDSLRPMNRSTPGLPVHHQLPEFIQTHVHRVSTQELGRLKLPGEGNGTPLQYSCLENPMGGGAW